MNKKRGALIFPEYKGKVLALTLSKEQIGELHKNLGLMLGEIQDLEHFHPEERLEVVLKMSTPLEEYLLKDPKVST